MSELVELVGVMWSPVGIVRRCQVMVLLEFHVGVGSMSVQLWW